MASKAGLQQNTSGKSTQKLRILVRSASPGSQGASQVPNLQGVTVGQLSSDGLVTTA